MKKIILLFILGVAMMASAPESILAADGSASIQLCNCNGKNEIITISVQDLEKIGTTEVDSYNPYEKRSDRYTGIWLNKLIEAYGDDDTKKLTLTALDDYTIDFFPTEWNDLKILLATKVNGQYIGYDKKGPMRIVFPEYDKSLNIYQEKLPKWIWMINRIEFK